MLKNHEQLIEFYEKTDEFIAAIEYTASRFGFRDALIEKDFLCSMVLLFLYNHHKLPICFKGGTLLAKVHAGFYRLSEDLDFSIAISRDAKRNERSELVKPCKVAIDEIPKYLPLILDKPLSGSNESRQYNAEFSYQSKVFAGKERILIEIGLREPHLTKPEYYKTNTLLSNPFSGDMIVAQYETRGLTQQEAYAEKIRAALTRKKLAIRDFYDIAYAINHNKIDLNKKDFATLIKQKLSLAGSEIVEFNEEKKFFLEYKVQTELEPTLSQKNAFKFDLDNVINQLKILTENLSTIVH